MAAEEGAASSPHLVVRSCLKGPCCENDFFILFLLYFVRLMCPLESIIHILKTAGGETSNVSFQTRVPNDLNICFHILEDER